jgi:hypothetical protein
VSVSTDGRVLGTKTQDHVTGDCLIDIENWIDPANDNALTKELKIKITEMYPVDGSEGDHTYAEVAIFTINRDELANIVYFLREEYDRMNREVEVTE